MSDTMDDTVVSDQVESSSTLPRYDKIYNASVVKRYPVDEFGQGGFRVDRSLRDNADSRQNVDMRVTGRRFRRIFGKHPSEEGWNLPKNHRRHLLNFPTDVLRHILSFLLVAHCEVTPVPFTYSEVRAVNQDGVRRDGRFNRDWSIQRPSYKMGSFHQPGYNEVFRSPSLRGDYVGWCRDPIDATIMRVCKVLYEEGLPLLYGENDFVWELSDEELYYTLSKEMNTLPRADELESSAIQDAVSNMFDAKDPKYLPSWVSRDPFARFLHSIGPRHASFIRKLRIRGVLFTTDQSSIIQMAITEWNQDRESIWFGNLCFFLKLYSLFIVRWCPNITKFGVGIEDIYTKDMSVRGGRGFSSIHQQEEELYETDPEDEALQDGDEKIAKDVGEDGLNAIKSSREENRLKKKAKWLLDIENSMAERLLKPIIDGITPYMKNLQTLEVKRHHQTNWEDLIWIRPSCTPPGYLREEAFVHRYVSTVHRSWYASEDRIDGPTPSYIGMDMAEDAKLAVAIAVFERSKEMQVVERLGALTLQNNPGQATEINFKPQIDLPDHPSASTRNGRPFRGGDRGRDGVRSRGGRDNKGNAVRGSGNFGTRGDAGRGASVAN